ncbi:SOUL family heme-binding protein [Yoonia vestfoldensis]|uniref:SOUL family heme-binding protein n=1 Tax=Yoonia vestfoldensis TaxID=245188 RepID=UPI00036AFAD8|nr:heme-binding protein [Yoonia vestfoldensis]
MSIEEPKFTLALKDGDFEIRDYAASVVAEVTVTGDQTTASSTGFRLLAGYIFGGNASRQKIAMTAPVTKTPKGEKIAMTAPVTVIAGTGDWLVRFTMPARYALADLPVPNDPAVTLRSVPAARFAVLRFSGFSAETKVAAETGRLLEIVRARGLRPVGPVSIARYNPPWTPWFLRRNEVMLPVAAEA